MTSTSICLHQVSSCCTAWVSCTFLAGHQALLQCQGQVQGILIPAEAGVKASIRVSGTAKDFLIKGPTQPHSSKVSVVLTSWYGPSMGGRFSSPANHLWIQVLFNCFFCFQRSLNGHLHSGIKKDNNGDGKEKMSRPAVSGCLGNTNTDDAAIGPRRAGTSGPWWVQTSNFTMGSSYSNISVLQLWKP